MRANVSTTSRTLRVRMRDRDLALAQVAEQVQAAVGQRRLRNRRAFVAQRDRLGAALAPPLSTRRGGAPGIGTPCGQTNLRAHRIEIEMGSISVPSMSENSRPMAPSSSRPAQSTRMNVSVSNRSSAREVRSNPMRLVSAVESANP